MTAFFRRVHCLSFFQRIAGVQDDGLAGAQASENLNVGAIVSADDYRLKMHLAIFSHDRRAGAFGAE